MTDHGGAASPRTEAGKRLLADKTHHGMTCMAFALKGSVLVDGKAESGPLPDPCECGLRGAILAIEAAQEAPAPKGRLIDSHPKIGALSEIIELELVMHNKRNGECACGDQLDGETFRRHVADAVDYRLTATDGDA